MKKRIKATTFPTREDFFSAIDEIAKHTVDLRNQEACRDERLQTIRDAYAGGIAQTARCLELLVVAAEKYATEHREELLPGKAKSTDTALATFGFRTGMPTLKTLSKWTWEKVLAALNGRMLTDYIRVKQEVDKEKLLAIGEGGVIEVIVREETFKIPLSDVGVKIAQEETFFIAPKDTASAS